MCRKDLPIRPTNAESEAQGEPQAQPLTLSLESHVHDLPMEQHNEQDIRVNKIPVCIT